jgi:hypothetical protein
MGIQKTLWSPDTCECQIEYQWDDSVPQDQRVHTISKIVKSCQIHSHHGSDKESHYADVLSENQSKNKAIGLLIKTLPNLDGKDKEIKWRFDNNRNVILSHDSLTKDDIKTLNDIDKSDIEKSVVIE